jgi:hypothetical protein
MHLGSRAWVVLLALALFAQGQAFGQNICKIGSEEFATLNAAVSYARSHGMSATNPVTIEMLTDYEVTSLNNAVTMSNTNDNIIITTAATGFTPIFQPTAGRTKAILARGWTGTSDIGGSTTTMNAIFNLPDKGKLETRNPLVEPSITGELLPTGTAN